MSGFLGIPKRPAHPARLPRLLRSTLPLVALLVSSALLSGCISKARARAQERAAFVAGEQQAMHNMQELRNSGPTISVVGPVKNPVLPWTEGLTLAKALVNAQFLGSADPTQILVVRSGEATPYDPKTLLQGKDVPLQPRDVVVIK